MIVNLWSAGAVLIVFVVAFLATIYQAYRAAIRPRYLPGFTEPMTEPRLWWPFLLVVSTVVAVVVAIAYPKVGWYIYLPPSALLGYLAALLLCQCFDTALSIVDKQKERRKDRK